MRVVELSNHPGQMLSEIRGRRQTAEQQERSRYEKAMARLTGDSRTRRPSR